MLDLLCGREMPPPVREIRDAWHARERDDSAVLLVDAELALSLERGACHPPEMWRALGAEASTLSRARVRRRPGPAAQKNSSRISHSRLDFPEWPNREFLSRNGTLNRRASGEEGDQRRRGLPGRGERGLRYC
jgi:hypothetical protein